MQIELSDYERTILLGVLEMHLEGMSEAREAMISDRSTLTTLTDFSDTLQQHDIDTKTVEAIKGKVLFSG